MCLEGNKSRNIGETNFALKIRDRLIRFPEAFPCFRESKITLNHFLRDKCIMSPRGNIAMSNTIEIEAKALVKQDEYRKLANLFRGSPRYVQTNYYIDTEDRLLAKEGVALRIREKQGQYELTLKTPLSEGLLEKNVSISFQQFADLRDLGEFPKTDIERFLIQLGFDTKKLSILTYLSTERIDVEYEGGLLSIDRNTYSGNTDYEVEFEYNSLAGAQKIMKEFLENNGVECHFSTASKVQRAMKAIGK